MELAAIQYRDGAVDFNRVFTLQTALTSQQDDLAVAQGDIAKNLVAVYKALGGGWQIRFGAGRAMGEPADLIQPGEVIPVPEAGENENQNARLTNDDHIEMASLEVPIRLPRLAENEQ